MRLLRCMHVITSGVPLGRVAVYFVRCTIRMGKAEPVRRTHTHQLCAILPVLLNCKHFGALVHTALEHGRQGYGNQRSNACVLRPLHTHLGRPKKVLLVLVLAQDVVHVELDACKCRPTCTTIRRHIPMCCVP